MRIADIIAQYADEGAVLIDLTAEAAQLYSASELPARLEARRLPPTTPLSSLGPPSETAVVLQQLSTSAGGGAEIVLDVGQVGARVFNLLVADRPEAFREQGTLDAATASGWEVIGAHLAEQPGAGFAIVLCPEGAAVPGEQPHGRLRAVNERGYAELVSRARERDLASMKTRNRELGERLAITETRIARIEKMTSENLRLQRELDEALTELASARKADAVNHGLAARQHHQARLEIEAQRRRADELQRRLDLTHKKMVRARTSVSFRLGRATKVAARASGKNPLAFPARWVGAFRERSGIPPGLEPLPAGRGSPSKPVARADAGPPPEPQVGQPGQSASAPASGVEQSAGRPATAASPKAAATPPRPEAQTDWRRKLAPLPGPTPKLAGVVGPDLAAQIDASTGFVDLAPNTWRHDLERAQPAYVLIAPEGLDSGTAWGSYGSPGGKDWAYELRDLTEWCRARGLPVVYWDTRGTLRPRLGIPRGVSFDAVFTVSSRLCGAEIGSDNPEPKPLGPAVEPGLYNPIRVLPKCAGRAVFADAFDRRRDRRDVDALEQLLVAAAARDLLILDPHWRSPGSLADAVRFPAALEPHCARALPVDAEARAIKAAGLLLVAGCAGADFVPWQLLRGLALGAHVLTTAEPTNDRTLAAAISSAAQTELAASSLSALFERPRLDRQWQIGFDHILTDYSLRDRLDAIAEACGLGSVTPGRPRVGVTAQVSDRASLDALRAFLDAQQASPHVVHVVAETGLDVTGALSGPIETDRLVIVPAGEHATSAALLAGDGAPSHLLCWHPALPIRSDAVSALESVARIADADLLALATPADDAAAASVPAYRYGAPVSGEICAVRRERLLDGLAAGQSESPDALIDALLASGSRSLRARRHAATGESEASHGSIA